MAATRRITFRENVKNLELRPEAEPLRGPALAMDADVGAARGCFRQTRIATPAGDGF